MRILTVLFVLFTLISCQPQAPAEMPEAETIDMDALKATLQAKEDAFAKAWNAGDAEAVVAYYSDDAVSLGDGQPPVSGKAAILAEIKQNIASDTAGTVSYQVVDVFASGDLAVEVGQSTRTKDGKSEVVGKYISVFQKRDGDWLCIRDSYSDNSDDEE